MKKAEGRMKKAEKGRARGTQSPFLHSSFCLLPSASTRPAVAFIGVLGVRGYQSAIRRLECLVPVRERAREAVGKG